MSIGMTPRIRSLLRQADKAAAANKRLAAEQLYRQLLAEAPDVPQAWLGLARVVDATEQADYYEKALLLAPDDVEAARELAILQGETPPPLPEVEEEEVSGLEAVDLTALDEQRNWSELATTANRFNQVAKPTGAAVSDHDHQPSEDEAAEILTCYQHPKRETGLRCSNCGRPICSSCAKPTPVGYRCEICLRELEDRLYEATPVTYLVAGAVAFFLGILAALIMSLIGFWIIAIFVGAGAGSAIGRIAFRAGGRRRGRYLPLTVATLVLLSGLPFIFSNLLGVGIYLLLATSAAYYQLR